MAQSGLRQRFRLTLADGRDIEVVTAPRDILEWEAKHRRGFFDTDRPSFQAMCWIAWKASARLGYFDGNFDAFVDALVDLAPDDDEDDAAEVFPTSAEAMAPSLSS